MLDLIAFLLVFFFLAGIVVLAFSFHPLAGAVVLAYFLFGK